MKLSFLASFFLVFGIGCCCRSTWDSGPSPVATVPLPPDQYAVPPEWYNYPKQTFASDSALTDINRRLSAIQNTLDSRTGQPDTQGMKQDLKDIINRLAELRQPPK